VVKKALFGGRDFLKRGLLFSFKFFFGRKGFMCGKIREGPSRKGIKGGICCVRTQHCNATSLGSINSGDQRKAIRRKKGAKIIGRGNLKQQGSTGRTSYTTGV